MNILTRYFVPIKKEKEKEDNQKAKCFYCTCMNNK